jgi:hypothetical protein
MVSITLDGAMVRRSCPSRFNVTMIPLQYKCSPIIRFTYSQLPIFTYFTA